MPSAYDVRGANSYLQQTSTGTSDIKTFTAPKSATGCVIQVDTTDARVTFDGSSPSATAGLLVKSGQAYPWYFPSGVTMKAVSTASANSVVGVQWLFN